MEPSLLTGQISAIRAEHISQIEAFEKPCRIFTGSNIQYSTVIMKAPLDIKAVSEPTSTNILRWENWDPSHENNSSPPKKYNHFILAVNI